MQTIKKRTGTIKISARNLVTSFCLRLASVSQFLLWVLVGINIWMYKMRITKINNFQKEINYVEHLIWDVFRRLCVWLWNAMVRSGILFFLFVIFRLYLFWFWVSPLRVFLLHLASKNGQHKILHMYKYLLYTYVSECKFLQQINVWIIFATIQMCYAYTHRGTHTCLTHLTVSILLHTQWRYIFIVVQRTVKFLPMQPTKHSQLVLIFTKVSCGCWHSIRI